MTVSLTPASALQTPDYLLIGHMTADITPNGRIPGGTVSYAVRTVASFGLNVGVLTSVQTGEPLLHEISSVADVVALPAEQTTTFENLYEPTGRKQYLRGVAAPIGVADLPLHFRAAKWVHLAPIAGEGDPALAQQFPDATVMLTLQGWLRQTDADGRVRFKRWFDRDILQSIDIVVFSEEDILEAPELEAEFAAVVPHLFVTRAERGGTYYRYGEPIPYATPEVQVVNPTGAGDVFAASLLASLPALGSDMDCAIRVAARLGAICVTRPGLEGAPTPDEVEVALAQAETPL